MGYIVDSTPEMGEYSVEVRSESFYLSGSPDSYAEGLDSPPRHCITVYPDRGDRPVVGGTVEILIEDVPKIRACLDAVEREAEE